MPRTSETPKVGLEFITLLEKPSRREKGRANLIQFLPWQGQIIVEQDELASSDVDN